MGSNWIELVTHIGRKLELILLTQLDWNSCAPIWELYGENCSHLFKMDEFNCTNPKSCTKGSKHMYLWKICCNLLISIHFNPKVFEIFIHEWLWSWYGLSNEYKHNRTDGQVTFLVTNTGFWSAATLLVSSSASRKLTVSYRRTGWVWEITSWSWRLQENYRSL